MPSQYRLRKVFSPLVRVIAKGLSRLGVTPNIATTIMFIFAILSCISLIVLNNLIIFSILVFLTGIFDGVDGAIARLTDKSTPLGGFFDSMMDRNSEFVIFLALLIYCWNQLLWYVIDMKIVIYVSFLASIMISYSRARAEVFFNNRLKEFKGDFDIGLLARSERLFFIFVSSNIAFFLDIFNELLFLFMILTIMTAIYRFIKIRQQIEERNE